MKTEEGIFNFDEIEFDDTGFGSISEEEADEFDDVQEEFDEPIPPKKASVEPKEQPKDSYFSAIVDSWKREGLLDDDFVVPDGGAAEFKAALIDHLYKPMKEAAEDEIEAYKESLLRERGLDEATLAVAYNIANGVNPETARGAMALSTIESLDIDSDDDDAFENRVNLIKTMHRYQGLDEESSDALIEKLQDTDQDLKKAREAKVFLKKMIEDKLEEERKSHESAKQSTQKIIDSFNDEVKKQIDSGDIMGGINKDKFYKDLYTPSVIMTVQDDNGKPKKVKATPWQAKLQELGVSIAPKNIEELRGDKLKKFLSLAHTVLYSDLKSSVVSEAIDKGVEDELDKLLKARSFSSSSSSDFDFDGVVEYLDI